MPGSDGGRPDAPRGVVALVVTDVEGSTALWERCGEGMGQALETHNRVIRACLGEHHGYEGKTQGDSFLLVFEDTLDATRFCLAAQAALLAAPWPPELLERPQAEPVTDADGRPLFRGLRVRMGIHRGE